MTSSALVTRTARASRISWWQPDEVIDVIGPGTAPTGRPASIACLTVLREPDRRSASTTTVPRVIPAMRRLRARNLDFIGAEPGATSDTTSPSRAIREMRVACPEG